MPHAAFTKVFYLFLALSLCACGSKNDTKSSASRGGVTTPSTGNSKLGECSQFSGSSTLIQGQIATYYTNGSAYNDYSQLNISSFAPEFYSSSNYIQFFRFKEPTAGQQIVNQVPTPFYLINKLTGVPTSQQTYDRLSRGLFEQIINDMGLDVFEISATNFINNYYVLLTGVEYQWTALRVSLMSSSGGLINRADALLPPYYADPNVFSSLLGVPYLTSLHPLSYLMTSGASETEFKRLSDQICTSFFGSVRNTASVENVTSGPTSGFLNWFKNLWATIISWF